MREIMYCVMWVGVFWISLNLSGCIGQAIGAGPFEIGLVITAISLLIATVVVCTMVIVYAIKDLKTGE